MESEEQETQSITPEEANYGMVKGTLERAKYNSNKFNDSELAAFFNASDQTIKRLRKEEPTVIIKKIMTYKFSPAIHSQQLMKTYKFLYDKYKRFWRYDWGEGIWKEDAEEIIRLELRTNLFGEEEQKSFYANEIIS